MMMVKLDKIKVGILGLGYVGLPLAVAFGKEISTIGFDISEIRIQELMSGNDHTFEVSPDEIKKATKLKFTYYLSEFKACNFYIVCVPTPVDQDNLPDLSNLEAASRTIGEILKKGDIVVYESTVYPGCTEEICIPILEKYSGLTYNKDFFCGYSPERINPGDKSHRIDNIIKITSGSNQKTADIIDFIYKIVAKAGTHKAPSIKVAEAAKVIENAQRDLNIAFMNELSIIFNLMKIDTEDVLNAAKTKWNFLDFKPGLVGGHCIGVDPYYLTYKANTLGYQPKLLLAGRALNDSMSTYICQYIDKEMAAQNKVLRNSKVLVLGYTFKENCPDVRNTKVKDIVDKLSEWNCKIDIYDPIATLSDVNMAHKKLFLKEMPTDDYNCIIFAVGHDLFRSFSLDKMRQIKEKTSILVDLKSLYPKEYSDFRL